MSAVLWVSGWLLSVVAVAAVVGSVGIVVWLAATIVLAAAVVTGWSR